MKYVGNRYTNIPVVGILVVVFAIVFFFIVFIMAVGRRFYAYGGHKIDARGI